MTGLPGRLAQAAWICHPELAGAEPAVLHFRRALQLDGAPLHFPIRVTADNRFILYVNGRRVASGPSTGTLARWRVTCIDIAPCLKAGHNVLAAVVWNFGAHAPLAQQSAGTGWWLSGENISTDTPGWRVKRDEGHSAGDGAAPLAPDYYVAGAPERIDAARANWGWAGEAEPGAGWVDAVPCATLGQRNLIDDPLPAQLFRPVSPGRLVGQATSQAPVFPAGPLAIPAFTRQTWLLQRPAMVCAYPELDVDGGQGAQIRLTYAEAMVDAEGNKADRTQTEGLFARGLCDTFLTDGQARTLAPLWWRTWRFVELDITTAAEPLTLRGFRALETGYPYSALARFNSNDAELNAVWSVGWRTARVNAHETFMDSAYWEQLQYIGDTRLQALVTYAVANDPRLVVQAIDAFAESGQGGGLLQGAYPSRGHNVISTFSLVWIAMLADWAMEQPDPSIVVRHLPRVRSLLATFSELETAQGLLRLSPHWNFIDWAGQRWDDREIFPSSGRDGASGLLTVMWLGALRQAAWLEHGWGDAQRAEALGRQAERAAEAIRLHCWNPQRQLFADNPAHTAYSQHMNALACLYDVTSQAQSRDILERIVAPGQGIDAPTGMFTTSYYFAWYLVQAFVHAGLSHRYLDLLTTWRGLLKLNYSTWPESRGRTRSDTHAWSAHPTADLLKIVAGIRSGAPGYGRVRIEPHLGHLTALEASAATPHGPVSVRYEMTDGGLQVDIRKPNDLPGEFVWMGQTCALSGERSKFFVAVRAPGSPSPGQQRHSATGCATPSL